MKFKSLTINAIAFSFITLLLIPSAKARPWLSKRDDDGALIEVIFNNPNELLLLRDGEVICRGPVSDEIRGASFKDCITEQYIMSRNIRDSVFRTFKTTLKILN